MYSLLVPVPGTDATSSFAGHTTIPYSGTHLYRDMGRWRSWEAMSRAQALAAGSSLSGATTASTRPALRPASALMGLLVRIICAPDPQVTALPDLEQTCSSFPIRSTNPSKCTPADVGGLLGGMSLDGTVQLLAQCIALGRAHEPPTIRVAYALTILGWRAEVSIASRFRCSDQHTLAERQLCKGFWRGEVVPLAGHPLPITRDLETGGCSHRHGLAGTQAMGPAGSADGDRLGWLTQRVPQVQPWVNQYRATHSPGTRQG